MITVLQRVQHAKVEIDGKTVGATKQGLLILLGEAEGDTRVEAGQRTVRILYPGTGGAGRVPY